MNDKRQKFFIKILEKLEKLEKKECVDIIKLLFEERQLWFDIIESSGLKVLIYRDHEVIYDNLSMVLVEIPQLELLPKNMIITVQDIYHKERILDIKYFISGRFRIFCLQDIGVIQEQDIKMKTQNSLNALEMLAAGIAHEIKNPLSAIDIHTQVIEKKIKNEIIALPKDFFDYIGVVKKESERLLLVVDHFLSRARKQKPILEFSEVKDIIEQTITLFQMELEQRQIKIIVSLEQVPRIFTVPAFLQQILSDIIRNAIDVLEFHETEKVIKITLRENKLKNAIIICIEDNGPGISLSVKKRIFEPYYTTKKNGTGLGLTLAKKMTQEIGGDIILKSGILGGAAFCILLPISLGQKKLPWIR